MTDATGIGMCVYCINCGFVGATHTVNGVGPYCGRCANQAMGRADTPPAPTADEPIRFLGINAVPLIDERWTISDFFTGRELWPNPPIIGVPV